MELESLNNKPHPWLVEWREGLCSIVALIQTSHDSFVVWIKRSLELRFRKNHSIQLHGLFCSSWFSDAARLENTADCVLFCIQHKNLSASFKKRVKACCGERMDAGGMFWECHYRCTLSKEHKIAELSTKWKSTNTTGHKQEEAFVLLLRLLAGDWLVQCLAKHHVPLPPDTPLPEMGPGEDTTVL